jgi:hypothetical protein
MFRIGERHYLFRVSKHCPHFVSNTLATWGDYCRVAKKSGADTFSKDEEVIRRKPLTETQSNCGFQQGESFEFLMRDWMWRRSFRMAATMAHL